MGAGTSCSLGLAYIQLSCIVVFDSPAGKRAALKTAGTGQIVECDLEDAAEAAGYSGLKAWVEEHKAARPGKAALQQQVRPTAAGETQ